MAGDGTGGGSTELVLVCGETRADLQNGIRGLRRSLEGIQSPSLAEIAFEAGGDYRPAPQVLAVVACSIADLERKLAFALERLEAPHCPRIKELAGVYYTEHPAANEGKLAFLFPGEGAQYSGMLADLCVRFPEARRWFDVVDSAFVGSSRDYLPSEVVYPSPTLARSVDVDALLWRMDIGSEAVFAASQALLAVVQRMLPPPDAVVGHSTGEYSALVAAGAVRLDDERAFLDNIRRLNALYLGAAADGLSRGVLLAVGGVDRDVVLGHVHERTGALRLAMDNCPHQLVLCTTADAETEATQLRSLGAVVQVLPYDRAYHTPLFEPFSASLRAFFAGLDFEASRIKIYSCATASPFPDEPEAMRDLAAAQYARPVRFRETIDAMHGAGVRVFVEVGPRANLTAFVRDTLGDRPHIAVATNTPRRAAITQLHHALAFLAAEGIPVDTARLNESFLQRGRAAAPRPGTLVDVQLTLPTLRLGQRDRRPTIPEPAGVLIESTASPVLLEHFQTMERFLAVEAEIVEAFLGAQPVTPAGTAAGVMEVESPSVSLPPVEPAPVEIANGSAGPHDLRGTLVGLIAERTGYPRELIDPNLDLEADLGIDSIKRVEILGALQQMLHLDGDGTIERLAGLRTIEELVITLEGGLASTAPIVARGPLLDEVTLTDDGRELVARRCLDPETDVFLRDHVLGGTVSNRDPSLRALAVLPVAVSVELLAEAALSLVPGVVTAVRGLRASRWVAVDDGTATIEVRARREGTAEDGEEVSVSLRILEEDSSDPAVEALVVVAQTYPGPPVSALDCVGQSPSFCTPERLYREAMFNGPALQGVASLDACSDSSASATLRVPIISLLDGAPVPLATDVVLADAAGQVVGFWAAERLETGFVVFPVAADAIEFFAPPLYAGEEAECRARIGRVGDDTLRSELEVTGPNGSLILRIRGWEDRRFAVSRALARFVLTPSVESLASDWTTPVAPFGAEYVCRRLDGLSDTLATSIWPRILAALVLGREERRRFRDYREGRRRNEWLLGRVAAKEAARVALARSHGLDFAAADIEIEPDEHGRPLVRVAAIGDGAPTPAVSISHAAGAAVAVAGGRADRIGVGIDIEPLTRAAELDGAGLGDGERELLRGMSEDERQQWALRMWCGKEAVGKALGLGLPGGPGDLRAIAIDTTGTVTFAVAGELLAGRDMPAMVAQTATEDGLVVASAIIERGGR